MYQHRSIGPENNIRAIRNVDSPGCIYIYLLMILFLSSSTTLVQFSFFGLIAFVFFLSFSHFSLVITFICVLLTFCLFFFLFFFFYPNSKMEITMDEKLTGSLRLVRFSFFSLFSSSFFFSLRFQ